LEESYRVKKKKSVAAAQKARTERVFSRVAHKKGETGGKKGIQM